MFKDFYEIPQFKKLDRIGKMIFVLSFLLPLGIIYTFLHLYFLPFGLNETYSLENTQIQLQDDGFFYERDLKEVLDGTSKIVLNSRIPRRNIVTKISVEGEGLYLIPEVFKESDISFSPKYTESFEEDFSYKLIDEYTPQSKKYIVFKIDYEINPKKQEGSELLLKFENLRIIQDNNTVEIQAEKKLENGDIKTYSSRLNINIEDSPITLYAIYKDPKEENGFIELFSQGSISDRAIIPKNELQKYSTQNLISLKREQNLHKFLQTIPDESREILESQDHYERIFNDFNGEIKEISVGYEYPIKLSKEFGTLYPSTPISFRIVGENAKIKDVKINIQRGAIWEKF